MVFHLGNCTNTFYMTYYTVFIIFCDGIECRRLAIRIQKIMLLQLTLFIFV